MRTCPHGRVHDRRRADDGQIVIAMTPEWLRHDGHAEISPSGGAKTQVGVSSMVSMTAACMVMIHASSICAGGDHVADLNNVVGSGAPHGGSVTVVDVPFSTIADGKNAIIAHGEGGSVVACGQIGEVSAAALQGPPSTGYAGALRRLGDHRLLAGLALAGTMIAWWHRRSGATER
jgi:hypothetical protein